MSVFWHLSGMVQRILQSEQKDTLHLTALAQNPEGAQEHWEALDKLTPDPIILNQAATVKASCKADEGGMDILRSLAG
jgi:hypothetical protein